MKCNINVIVKSLTPSLRSQSKIKLLKNKGFYGRFINIKKQKLKNTHNYNEYK